MTDPELKLSILESKMEAVDEGFKENSRRFNRIETRLDGLEERLSFFHSSLETRMTDLQSSMESRITNLQISTESRITNLQGSLEGRITKYQSSTESRISNMQGTLEGRITNLHEAITKQTRWILLSFGAFITAVFSGFAALIYKLTPVLHSLSKALQNL